MSLIILFSALTALTLAQPPVSTCTQPETRFFNLYDGSPLSVSISSLVSVAPDGVVGSQRYYACGYMGGKSGVIMRMKEDSTIDWQEKILWGTSTDCRVVTASDADKNNIYVMGQYFNLVDGMYIAQVEALTGTLLWSTGYQVISSASALDPSQLIIDGDATFLYVIGKVSIIAALGQETFIAKVNIAEKRLEKFVMQGSPTKIDLGVSVTMDRFRTSLYTLGSQNRFYAGVSPDYENTVSLMTTDLVVRWTRRFGTNSNDQAFHIKSNPTKDFFVVVGQMKYGGIWSPLIVYFDSYGTIQWKKSIIGTDDDTVIQADFTRDGNQLFFLGEFRSNEYKSTGVPAVGQSYLTFIKFNLIKLTAKSMDRTLAVMHGGYGNYADTFMIDQRNNVIIAGHLVSTTSPRKAFLVKLQPSLNDWACFMQSKLAGTPAQPSLISRVVDLIPSIVFTDSEVPTNYETYMEDGSQLQAILSLAMTVTPISLGVQDQSPTCTRAKVLGPLLTQYYFEFNKYDNIKIKYDYFWDCNVSPSGAILTTSHNIQGSYVGVEYDVNGYKVHLQKISSGMWLYGSAIYAGTYNIVVKGHVAAGSNQLIQSWAVMTLRVYGDTYPIEKNRFYMKPEAVVVLREYRYSFDIREFFSSSTPILRIVPKVKTFDPSTYDPVYSPLPSWLNFDQQSMTFWGRPTGSDPSIAGQEFPITYMIALQITDRDMLSVTSYAGTLRITNYKPQFNPDFGAHAFLGTRCPGLGKPLLLTVPAQTFSDEDRHHLYYSVHLSDLTAGGTNFPRDGIFFDPSFNTLVGVPTLKTNYYSVLRASDGYSEAQLDLNMFVSKAPQRVPSECKKIKSVIIEKPIRRPIYINFKSCLVDEDSELVFEARLSLRNGGKLPNCIKMSPFDGRLVIYEEEPPSPECSGTFYVVVTAYDKDVNCQQVSFESVITINTPVDSRIAGPTNFKAAINRPFLLKLNQSAYFVEPDLNDTLRFSLSLAPNVDLACQNWVQFNNLTLWGIPSNPQLINMTCTYRVSARDFGGREAFVDFRITIEREPKRFWLNRESEKVVVKGNTTLIYRLPQDLVDNPSTTQLVMSSRDLETYPDLTYIPGDTNSTFTVRASPIPSSRLLTMHFFDSQMSHDTYTLNMTVVPPKPTIMSPANPPIILPATLINLTVMQTFSIQLIPLDTYGLVQLLSWEVQPAASSDWLHFNPRNLSLSGTCCGSRPSPPNHTSSSGTLTYHLTLPNGTARVYQHPYQIIFTTPSEPRVSTLGIYLLQAAVAVAGLAGVYLTQYGGEGVREAQVLRVGNRYTVKRKNLRKYASRYEQVAEDDR